MKALTLETLAAYCGGRLACGNPSVTCTSVNTDSRKIQPGELFIALVGERFDAHDFVAQVAHDGAAAVVVSRMPAHAEDLGCAVILVPDTLLALQNLARAYRELLNPLVIGITGSNGKTSTKDLVAAVLRRKYKVCATLGNFNNHIGLPLTLLRMEEGDNCAVLEMGMNHHGEIAVLAGIARPDAAIITNIGVAHIEYMGSREGIAQEKGMLAEAVPHSGVVVLNANDDFSSAIAARAHARVILAGVGEGDVVATLNESDARGSQFTLNLDGHGVVDVQLPVPGEHMVGNAALAAAIGWHFGVAPRDIAAALSEVQLTKGRVQVKSWRGVTVLDDSYNANPDSMRAGLKTLAGLKVPGRRVAVLGRMGELGPHAESSHREVGSYAAELGLDAVFTVGDEAALISDQASASTGHGDYRNFPTHARVAACLTEWLHEGDAVLLKGSRSAGMEQVLTHLDNPAS
jgi:UDP-N-acetylmuramoyl-tripeptide--D-alanyl-D-alanine ligase